MSLGLTLYPSRHTSLDPMWFGCHMLEVEVDGWSYYIRSQDRFLYPHRLLTSEGCRWHDSYGDPLTYMYAKDLAALVAVSENGEECKLLPYTKAAIAYLKELPPLTPVVLYFH